MVMIYEHLIKKRVDCPIKLNKNDPAHTGGFIIKCYEELEVIREKRKCRVPRHAYHQIQKREFSLLKQEQFWTELFNVKRMKPFLQLIKAEEYQNHKYRVTKKLTELLSGESLLQNKGALERDVTKKKELLLSSDGEPSTPGGRKRIHLSRQMVDEAMDVYVKPENRISNYKIDEVQGNKPVSAYHFKLTDGGKGGPPQLQRGSIRQKVMMQHPDQQRDLEPLSAGLSEPHEGIRRAHRLSLDESKRQKHIKD